MPLNEEHADKSLGFWGIPMDLRNDQQPTPPAIHLFGQPGTHHDALRMSFSHRLVDKKWRGIQSPDEQ